MKHDHNNHSSYPDEEIARFDDLIANYKRVGEFCAHKQVPARHDGLIFMVCFILTGAYLPTAVMQTAEQRRRHLAGTLQLNDEDAQFLIEIYEREKSRRPGDFPDIGQLLSEARPLGKVGAEFTQNPRH